MSKENSYLDWEMSLKHNNIKETLGISSREFNDYLEKWTAENLENIEKDERNLISVLDIETTGLDPYLNMICEIGVCSLDLESGKIEPLFHIICQEENKEFDENAWIFQNSDLTIYTVRKAPYLEECRETLQRILDIHPLTAYNQSFDFSFLESRDFKIHKKFWDPMHKLTPILKIPRYNGYKWPSVQEAYDYFYPKERYLERHRALDDARHEAKIIYATNNLLKERD